MRSSRRFARRVTRTESVRVLLAHNRYRTPGGEERHVELLADVLRASGLIVESFIAAIVEGASLRSRIGLAAGLPYRPSAARSIGSIIERFRPDVLHAHNLTPLLAPSVLREAK